MFEDKIKEILDGKVVSIPFDEIGMFIFESETPLEKEKISNEDVSYWYDEKDNVFLVGILSIILENQNELAENSHCNCCLQLAENCNCGKYSTIENDIDDVEDDGEYSWQGQ